MKAGENPFATERVEQLLGYEPSWHNVSWESIEEQWARNGRRGAIVGPNGSGKTTFLDALAERLEGQSIVRVFLNESTPVPRFESGQFKCQTVLLDGAEQLNWLVWRRFLKSARHASGIVITQHREGRLPTILNTRSSVEILEKCIDRLGPGLSPHAARLFEKHGGNLREALLECYDLAHAKASCSDN